MTFSIGERAKLVWKRVTFSHVTIAFVVFTLVTGILQVALTGATLTRNLDALKIVNHLSNGSTARNGSQQGVSFVLHNGTVLECTAPPGSGPNACAVVWPPSSNPNPSTTSLSTSSASSTSTSASSSSTRQSSSSSSSPVPATTHASSITRNNQAFVTGGTTTFTSLPTSTSVTHLSRPTSDKIEPSKTTDHSSSGSPTISTRPSSTSETKKGGDSDQDDVAGTYPGRGPPRVTSTGNMLGPGPTPAPFSPLVTSLLSARDEPAQLSSSCVSVLVWPDGILQQSSREDAVFLAFILWNWGISIVAILNESTPHTIAASFAHLLTFGWSVFQLVHTINFRNVFFDIAVHGACDGQNILPGYWEARVGEQIAVLVVSTLAVFASLYLTWRLFADFGWQSFQRVGASPAVNRLYKLALALSVIIQFALFFILAAAILWIDQIKPRATEEIFSYARLNEIGFIILTILLIPWTLTGWYGVRRGSRVLSIVFLLGTVMFLVSFSVLFKLNGFLLFFLSWQFFALIVVWSIVLTGLAVLVGAVCYLHLGMIKGTLNGYLQRDEEARPRVRDLSSDVEDVRSPFRSPWPSRRTEWVRFDPEPETVIRPKRSRNGSSAS